MRYGADLSNEQIARDITPHVGNFVEDADARLGNENSAHTVMFGDSELGPIAVKPFGKHQRALMEKRALEAVGRKGILAFEPLAVIKGAVASYLITKRVPDLRHLGQLDWRVDGTSPRLRASITPTLHDVADTLASNHKLEVVHGDFQPKNAMLVPPKRPIYGDAEKTWVDPPITEMTGLGNKDVALFAATALSFGLLADRSPSYRTGYLREEYLDRYIEAVNPELFAMDPEQRQQAIVNYWLEGIGRGGVAPWPGRQMQGGHAA